MGREAEAQALWHGQSGVVKAVLEGDCLILRGDIRLKLPREALLAWQGAGPDLRLTTVDGPLTLTLGEREVAAWQAHLAKPRPSLRDKLGFGPAARAFAMTPVTDTAMAMAMAGYETERAEDAVFLVAVLQEDARLEEVILAANGHRGHIWLLHEKGRHPALPESKIRTAMRAAGFIDSKACAVSDQFSATRYARRKDGEKDSASQG